MKDVYGLVGVMGALAFLMSIVTLAVRKLPLNAEVARKTVHVGMGIICLFFPLIFEYPRTVWLLAAIAISGMCSVKLSRFREKAGSSLYSVNRLSVGEILFPLEIGRAHV